jgi:alkanesulfonate monooxygenase SsuD/methylene tetrahydromethanopterin reductase-like flavin-dependent oxidoreductase (luciferase family)
LKEDETGEPFHVQQAKQIRHYREAWEKVGHAREPRVSVSRSIFGRPSAAEPDRLVEELKADEAVAEADTLLLTIPNQLGVEYNAHVMEAILKHVDPVLGWR